MEMLPAGLYRRGRRAPLTHLPRNKSHVSSFLFTLPFQSGPGADSVKGWLGFGGKNLKKTFFFGFASEVSAGKQLPPEERKFQVV